MGVEVNFLAVILAAVAQMALGFLWYGPLFGKPWMKMKGFANKSKEETAEMQKKMMPYYGVTFVLALVTAYVLAHVMFLSQNFFDYSSVVTGLMSGFWMWLGFMLPVQAGAIIFSENRNWKLLSIDTTYQLVALLVMGLVLGLM